MTISHDNILLPGSILLFIRLLGSRTTRFTIGGSITVPSIERDGKYFTPEGTTRIQKGDRLSVLADDPVAINHFYKVLGIESGD